ncbi:MAG: FmdB family zinc ribbon protein [Candidatus Nanopelagicales bacterium]
MPTYQYQCTDCGEALEVVQAFTDDSLTECPNCGGRLRKLFNAVGIVFKGSGFYRTDSRSGSSSSVGSSSSSSSSSDSGSSTTSTPAATPSTSSSSSTSSGSSTGSGTSGSAA